MADFPTLSKDVSVSYEEQIIKPSVRVKFEGNYVQSRPKYTRTQKIFKISFSALTSSDISTLNTFFDDNHGSSFNWTNPVTSTVFNVRFMEDSIKYKHQNVNLFSTTFSLEEI